MNEHELGLKLRELDKQLGLFRENLKMPQYKNRHLAEIRDKLAKIAVELLKERAA